MAASVSQAVATGCEWIIDARGCNPAALADLTALTRLFDAIIAGMDLHPVAPTQWHQFPNTGGITGLTLLAESHLTCHTFPEYGSLCLNVFCCRTRPEGDFEAILRATVGTSDVQIRTFVRALQTL